MSNSGLLGALIALLGTFSVVAVLWLIILIVANWKIFTKAGEAGWKCLIPFYNQYVRFGFTWETKYFWVALVLTVLGNIVAVIKIPVIGTLLSIAAIVIYIIAIHKLSKAFGHGVGFTLGLIFLNPIFVLILAFGSSEYIGQQ